jgi:hypothetical protein
MLLGNEHVMIPVGNLEWITQAVGEESIMNIPTNCQRNIVHHPTIAKHFDGVKLLRLERYM